MASTQGEHDISFILAPLTSQSTRNIQTQLSALLPDNVTEWRQYRPCGKQQGVHRLAQFKRCKENQVCRYARYRSRQKAHQKGSSAESSPCSSREFSSVFYNPSRHYEETLLGHTPSHSFIAPNQLYSSLARKPKSDAGDIGIDPSSDKEVIIGGAGHGDRQLDGVVQQPQPLQGSTITSPVTSDQAASTPPGITRSNSRASSIGGATIRTMSTRISSRLSHSLRHVNSVLSASNSFRSSLVYAASISSGRLSSTSEVPWSRDELNAWNEFVDESALASETIPRPDVDAKSLYNRPCCGFWKSMPSPETRLPCRTCGYSREHYQARYGSMALIDCSTTDKFGNTPLHHAAAEGNATIIHSSILSNGVISLSKLSHRNTSGETFLHVFRLLKPSDFAEYLKILRVASSQGFQFTTCDYNGRRISQRLHELTDDWGAVRPHLKDVGEILGCRLKETIFGESPRWEPQSIASSASSDVRLSDFFLDDLVPGDSMLTATLKNWPRNPLSRAQLLNIIEESDIHRRDDRGYTGLAIAARLGVREAVSLLLERGANPNTRSHQKTSIIAHATAQLSQAQKEDKVDLYARILSCIVLLSDHGAKPVATEYDEYYVYTPATKKKPKFAPGTFMKQTLSQISKTRSKARARNIEPMGAMQSNVDMKAELEATQAEIKGTSNAIVEMEDTSGGFTTNEMGSTRIPDLVSRHNSAANYNPGPQNLADFLVQHIWLEDIPEHGEDCLPPYPGPSASFPANGGHHPSESDTVSLPRQVAEAHEDLMPIVQPNIAQQLPNHDGRHPPVLQRSRVQRKMQKPTQRTQLELATPEETVVGTVLEAYAAATESSSVTESSISTPLIRESIPAQTLLKNHTDVADSSAVNNDQHIFSTPLVRKPVPVRSPSAKTRWHPDHLRIKIEAKKSTPTHTDAEAAVHCSQGTNSNRLDTTKLAAASSVDNSGQGWSTDDYNYDFAPPPKRMQVAPIPQPRALSNTEESYVSLVSNGRQKSGLGPLPNFANPRDLFNSSDTGEVEGSLPSSTLQKLQSLPTTATTSLQGHQHSAYMTPTISSGSKDLTLQHDTELFNERHGLHPTGLHQTFIKSPPLCANEAITSPTGSLIPELTFDTRLFMARDDYFQEASDGNPTQDGPSSESHFALASNLEFMLDELQEDTNLGFNLQGNIPGVNRECGQESSLSRNPTTTPKRGQTMSKPIGSPISDRNTVSKRGCSTGSTSTRPNFSSSRLQYSSLRLNIPQDDEKWDLPEEALPDDSESWVKAQERDGITTFSLANAIPASSVPLNRRHSLSEENHYLDSHRNTTDPVYVNETLSHMQIPAKKRRLLLESEEMEIYQESSTPVLPNKPEHPYIRGMSLLGESGVKDNEKYEGRGGSGPIPESRKLSLSNGKSSKRRRRNPPGTIFSKRGILLSGQPNKQEARAPRLGMCMVTNRFTKTPLNYSFGHLRDAESTHLFRSDAATAVGLHDLSSIHEQVSVDPGGSRAADFGSRNLTMASNLANRKESGFPDADPRLRLSGETETNGNVQNRWPPARTLEDNCPQPDPTAVWGESSVLESFSSFLVPSVHDSRQTVLLSNFIEDLPPGKSLRDQWLPTTESTQNYSWPPAPDESPSRSGSPTFIHGGSDEQVNSGPAWEHRTNYFSNASQSRPQLPVTYTVIENMYDAED
jgi:hypothetical protein